MITYNQESYILKSIQSAINQKTSFEYEIIIADDKSTDSTNRLLDQLAEKNNTKISLINNKVNIGASRNLLNVLKHAKGKYIAILEGDDYWQDTNKLQSCFEFMENNIEFSVIHHKVNVVTNENLIIGELPKDIFRNNYMSLEDLILNDSFMATCSIFFRNYFKTDEFTIPESLFTIRNMADWPLNIFLASRGKIGYVDTNMASYRVASGKSSWSKRNYSEILLDAIKINNVINKELDFKYDQIIKNKIIKYELAICVDYLLHLRLKKFIDLYYEIKIQNIEKIYFIIKKLFSIKYYFYYGAFKMLFMRINKKIKSILK